MGWASKMNGELHALATAEFDVFPTSDRNLSHRLNVGKFDIAVLVLVAGSNRSTTCAHLCRKSARLSSRSS
jgi:hypothetical protein